MIICEICDGEGWCWRHELPDPSEDGGYCVDDTRYTCPWCKGDEEEEEGGEEVSEKLKISLKDNVAGVELGDLPVRFKKIRDNAELPTYAKPGDACMDLVAADWSIDINTNMVEYYFGWAVEIPEGHVGLIFPRSSVSRRPLMLANGVGVIDSGYRGEVSARFHVRDNHWVVSQEDQKLKFDMSQEANLYKAGDRVAQMMILPIPLVKVAWANELSDTDRGEGGFGSTGE